MRTACRSDDIGSGDAAAAPMDDSPLVFQQTPQSASGVRCVFRGIRMLHQVLQTKAKTHLTCTRVQACLQACAPVWLAFRKRGGKCPETRRGCYATFMHSHRAFPAPLQPAAKLGMLPSSKQHECLDITIWDLVGFTLLIRFEGWMSSTGAYQRRTPKTPPTASMASVSRSDIDNAPDACGAYCCLGSHIP